ncbi:inverse autotransporter beta domain-containing protein, partial [Aeromonas caviae]
MKSRKITSPPNGRLLSDRLNLHPVALLLAGLQLFIPVGTSVASVAQAVSAHSEQDSIISSHLVQAVGVVQADSSQAAKSYATGLANGALNSAANEWINQFGTARVDLGFDQKFNVERYSFDMMLPLYDNSENLFFTQFGIRNKDERNTVNIGYGMRHITENNWMLGGNTFFDNDLTGNNRRLGFGVEAWTDYLKFSANGYLGLTNWHQSRDFADYDERPANGWDIRAEGWLPTYAQLGGKLTLEQYYGNEVALIGKDTRQHNPIAMTAGVNWSPFPLVTLGADHRFASGGKQDSQVYMSLTVRPGMSLEKHFDASGVASNRTLAGSRADLVERNNHIVLDYRKQELMKLTLPSSLSAPAATVLTVQAQVEAKYGLQEIDWHAPQLERDGGKLAVMAPDRLAVTLPVQARAEPYELTGVARDMRGNASERAVTHITVTEGANHGVDANKTVIPSTLSADGSATARVLLTLKDAAGQPITGQADALSYQMVHTPVAGTMIARASAMVMSLMNDVAVEPQMSAFSETEPGEYEAVFTAGSVPGTVMLTTYWQGNELAAERVTLVRAENTDGAQISAGALIVVSNNAVADGIATNSVSATVTDANGVPLANQVVLFSADNGAVINSSGTTDADGHVLMTISSVKAGVSKVTATIKSSVQSVDVSFVAGPGIPGTAVVENDQAPANGTDTVTVTFPVQDANGNPSPGTVVDVVITRPDGSTDTQQVVTDSNGNATISVDSTLPGTVTIEGSANGNTSTVDIEFTPDPTGAVIAAGDFVPVDNNAVADGVATNSVRATVTRNGAPVAGIRVNFSANNGATIAATGTTDVNGEVVQTLTSTTAGTTTVTATVNNVSSTVDVTFVAGTGTPGSGTVTGNGAVANGTDTVTVTFPVTDANGNPAPGQSVDITITYPDGSTDTQTVVTDSNGNATVDVDSTQAGTVTVEASTGGSASSQDVDFVADSTTATLAAGSLTVVDDNAVADGVATNSVQATVTDANGNPV